MLYAPTEEERAFVTTHARTGSDIQVMLADNSGSATH